MPESLIEKNELPGVVQLTLNRPLKRNALTREMLHELARHLTDLASRTDIRLLVLGARGTVFCAGMDLAQMEETATLADSAVVWQADTDLYRSVLRSLFEIRCPTLAVVPGPAVAGGLGLVLAC